MVSALERCTPRAGCYCATGKVDVWNWSFVDTAFCICLRDRDDRKRHAEDQFHKVGLCTKVLFYRAEKPTLEEVKMLNIKERGYYGSWESHRAVTRLALQLGSKSNLVFEDDVLFRDILTPATLEVVAQHVRDDLPDVDPLWEIYYLGHMPLYGCLPTPRSQMWRTHSTMLHAYVQSLAWMKRFAAMPFVGYGKDGDQETQLDFWTMRKTRQYAHRPMLAVQADMRSDNAAGGWKEKGIAYHAQHPALMEFVFMQLVLILLALALVSAIAFAVVRLTQRRRRGEMMLVARRPSSSSPSSLPAAA